MDVFDSTKYLENSVPYNEELGNVKVYCIECERSEKKENIISFEWQANKLIRLPWIQLITNGYKSCNQSNWASGGKSPWTLNVDRFCHDDEHELTCVFGWMWFSNGRIRRTQIGQCADFLITW